VYQSENCVEYQFGRRKFAKCRYVEFPDHPHRQRREPCGAVLYDEKLSTNSTIKLVPKKVYPCVSIKSKLTRLASQPHFLVDCEHWRTRSHLIPSGTLADVYDGKV